MSRPIDWHGWLMTKYHGQPKFASARFSSRELAMMWFQRARAAAAIARIPLNVAIYHQGNCIRRHGDW